MGFILSLSSLCGDCFRSFCKVPFHLFFYDSSKDASRDFSKNSYRNSLHDPSTDLLGGLPTEIDWDIPDSNNVC